MEFEVNGRGTVSIKLRRSGGQEAIFGENPLFHGPARACAKTLVYNVLG
jgi:hypothetical protein